MNKRTDRWMKKTCRIVAVALMIAIVMCIPVLQTHADAGTASGKVMELKEPVTVYTEKSTDSAVLVTYKAGEVIFVTGDTGDGWYTVFFRGTTGYLSKTVSSPEDEDGIGETDEDGGGGSSGGSSSGESSSGGSSSDATHELELEEFAGADQEAIDEELSQINVESTYLVEEVQRYEKARHNATIWVIIIAVIAVALVITGIVAYKRNNTLAKSEEKEKDATETKVIREKMDIINLDEE